MTLSSKEISNLRICSAGIASLTWFLILSFSFVMSLHAQELPANKHNPSGAADFDYPRRGIANVFVPEVLTEVVESRFYPGIFTYRLKNPLPSQTEINAGCSAASCPIVQLIEYDAFGPGGRECGKDEIAGGASTTSAASPATECIQRCYDGCCFPKRWKWVDNGTIGSWACEWPQCEEAEYKAQQAGVAPFTDCSVNEYCAYEAAICPLPENMDQLPPHYIHQEVLMALDATEYVYEGFKCLTPSEPLLPATDVMPEPQWETITTVKNMCCDSGSDPVLDTVDDPECPEECPNDCVDAGGVMSEFQKVCKTQNPTAAQCGRSNAQYAMDQARGLSCNSGVLGPDRSSKTTADICKQIGECAFYGKCPPYVRFPKVLKDCDTPPQNCSMDDLCGNGCSWKPLEGLRSKKGGGGGNTKIARCWWNALGSCDCGSVAVGKFASGPGGVGAAGRNVPKAGVQNGGNGINRAGSDRPGPAAF